MTKKDYITFANLIKGLQNIDQYKNSNDVSYVIDWVLTQEIANIFENDNPRFNRQRFFDYINR